MYTSTYILLAYFILRIFLKKFKQTKKILYFDISLNVLLILFSLFYFSGKIIPLYLKGGLAILLILIGIISLLIFNIYSIIKKLKNNYR